MADTEIKLPEMHAVTSSNVEAIGYADGDLFVRFRGGKVYRYDKVPAVLYQDLRALKAPGKEIASKVVGRYTFVRVI